MAEDVTAEADSGGHTDRRPLVGLLPTLQRLRDRIASEEGYAAGRTPRIGAGGGIGIPSPCTRPSPWARPTCSPARSTRSCVEAGTSDLAKTMLASAGVADCATGPAPDMFELGAHVQVLGQGTMYAQRAQRLYDLYKRYPSMADIPAKDRSKIERTIFRQDLDTVWANTREYWAGRDPEQVARADKDPRHQMALTFRWYLGMTSRWAGRAIPTAAATTRSGAGPRWGCSTTGSGAPGWMPWRTAARPRSPGPCSTAPRPCARVEVARALGVALPTHAATPVPVRAAPPR